MPRPASATNASASSDEIPIVPVLHDPLKATSATSMRLAADRGPGTPKRLG